MSGCVKTDGIDPVCREKLTTKERERKEGMEEDRERWNERDREKERLKQYKIPKKQGGIGFNRQIENILLKQELELVILLKVGNYTTIESSQIFTNNFLK